MLGSLLRILALTRKELLAVLKDPRSRMSLLVPPVVQALIFGYAATYDLNHVTYAALDQDHTAASRQLLAGLDGSGVFERVANLQRATDMAVSIRVWSRVKVPIMPGIMNQRVSRFGLYQARVTICTGGVAKPWSWPQLELNC